MVRIYSESIKKWAISAGLGGVSLIGLYFLYLSMIGAITITGYSGDSVCAGTLESPCYAYINFTANEDIFIYPTDYDPWGRNTPFEFDPSIKDWKLQRSWGTGWRTLPLNQSCTGTWCGLSSSTDTRKFSVAFRKGKDYQIRIVAYKNTPADAVKWGAFGEIDPVWIGVVNVTLISNTDNCFNCKTVFKVCKLADLTASQTDVDFNFYNKKLNKITQDYDIYVWKNVVYNDEVDEFINITKSFKCNSTDFEYTLTPKKYACCKYQNGSGIDTSFCHPFETGNLALKTIYWTEQEYKGTHIEQHIGMGWSPVTKSQLKNAILNAPINTCWNVSLESDLEWGDSIEHILEFGEKNWTEYTWWNAAWGYRKTINITNIASNSVLRKWYTINMTVENLTGSGKMQADYDDVRVTYNATGTDVELNRIISAYNSTHFLLQFAAQANITNGTISTNEYWLYYGNAAANSPPTNKSLVYLYWTNFSSYDFTEVDTNNYIRYNSSTEVLDFEIHNSPDAYAYINLGASTRGADVLGFEATWDVVYTGVCDTGDCNQFTGFGDVLDDLSVYWGTHEGGWFYQVSEQYGTRTLHTYSGGPAVDVWDILMSEGTYYMTLSRINTTLLAVAYNDSARTEIYDSGTVASGSEQFTYFFVLNMYKLGSAGNSVDGYYDNVKIIRRLATNPTYILGSEESIPVITFVGTVEDSNGIGIANATVYIILQDTNTWVTNLTTNSTGGWVYPVSTPGNYSICAHNQRNVSQGGDCKPFVLVTT